MRSWSSMPTSRAARTSWNHTQPGPHLSGRSAWGVQAGRSGETVGHRADVARPHQGLLRGGTSWPRAQTYNDDAIRVLGSGGEGPVRRPVLVSVLVVGCLAFLACSSGGTSTGGGTLTGKTWQWTSSTTKDAPSESAVANSGELHPRLLEGLVHREGRLQHRIRHLGEPLDGRAFAGAHVLVGQRLWAGLPG